MKEKGELKMKCWLRTLILTAGITATLPVIIIPSYANPLQAL